MTRFISVSRPDANGGSLYRREARSEGRIVPTFDLDFGEIMALSGRPGPSVILFRLRNQTPCVVTPRLVQVIQESESQLAAGAFVTVEDYGYRLRRLPIR